MPVQTYGVGSVPRFFFAHCCYFAGCNSLDSHPFTSARARKFSADLRSSSFSHGKARAAACSNLRAAIWVISSMVDAFNSFHRSRSAFLRTGVQVSQSPDARVPKLAI